MGTGPEDTCRACGSPAKKDSPLCGACWGKLPRLVRSEVYREKARGRSGRAHEVAVKRAKELRERGTR